VLRISVLAVDDHPVFVDALQARLSAEPDIGPVSVAYSAGEALARVARSPVDVAVLDFRLGDTTGVVLAERLRRAQPRTRTVMLSAVDSVESVVDALAAGARAWLPKTVDTAHLVRVIRGVHAGEVWIAPPLLGKVIPVLLDRALAPPPDPLAELTAREREVLDCMVEGLSRTEIAARLHMSSNTVRTHTQNLMGKLGAHSSLEAVTIALRTARYSTRDPVR
jgi:DNA-binding NarL/FixJ family response regulator